MTDETVLEPDAFYTVAQIADAEWLKSPISGTTDRQYIYKLIRSGRLKAKNIGAGSQQPRYVVTGENIINYLADMRS